MNNAIVFCGNTGVGKSYVCNRIFKMYGSNTVFKSTASINSETGAIQHGKITTGGITYTILDTPGFFDTKSPNNRGETDGANMCNLVAALQSCEQIFAIVFVFTDRFSEPHMIWFERMVSLVTPARIRHIILLHNKLEPLDAEQRAENSMEIKYKIQGRYGKIDRVEYIWFSSGGGDSQLQCLMIAVTKLAPFKMSNLIVPDMCYNKMVESEPFKEVIANVKIDEGCHKDEIIDTSHNITDIHYGEKQTLGLFGPRKPFPVLNWVQSSATNTIWVPKEVQYRTVATYVNIYKVRFDGTKDLVEKKQVGELVKEVYRPGESEEKFPPPKAPFWTQKAPFSVEGPAKSDAVEKQVGNLAKKGYRVKESEVYWPEKSEEKVQPPPKEPFWTQNHANSDAGEKQVGKPVTEVYCAEGEKVQPPSNTIEGPANSDAVVQKAPFNAVEVENLIGKRAKEVHRSEESEEKIQPSSKVPFWTREAPSNTVEGPANSDAVEKQVGKKPVTEVNCAEGEKVPPSSKVPSWTREAPSNTVEGPANSDAVEKQVGKKPVTEVYSNRPEESGLRPPPKAVFGHEEDRNNNLSGSSPNGKLNGKSKKWYRFLTPPF